jgi:hypothetical protein
MSKRQLRVTTKQRSYWTRTGVRTLPATPFDDANRYANSAQVSVKARHLEQHYKPHPEGFVQAYCGKRFKKEAVTSLNIVTDDADATCKTCKTLVRKYGIIPRGE